tara:strand:+ start:1568 stop:1777 length:210 start_codon:yes stop_codon:yes gene_type:complete
MIIRLSNDEWINLNNVELITLTHSEIYYPKGERDKMRTLNFYLTSELIHRYHDTFENIKLLLKKYNLDL